MNALPLHLDVDDCVLSMSEGLHHLRILGCCIVYLLTQSHLPISPLMCVTSELYNTLQYILQYGIGHVLETASIICFDILFYCL